MLEHSDSLILLLIIPVCSVFAKLDPVFDATPLNLTIISGKTAVLPCTVENRGEYMMTWMHPKRVLISTDDRRVIDDTRMSVERPFVRDWNLHIRHVRYNDIGEYRCTINTNPVQIKRILLIVKVPPTIIHKLSTGNIRVREGTTVNLVCNSTGIPEPIVRWSRRAADSTEKTHIGSEGEVLLIKNISRHCDGTYECLADNGVPPAVTRQMDVDVTFPPGIKLRTKRIWQLKGKETILECIINASPQAVSFWKHERGPIKTKSNLKYRTEVHSIDRHSVILNLHISDLHEKDFGEYICEASNSLGRDRKSMLLKEYLPTTPKNIPTTTKPIKISTVYEFSKESYVDWDEETPILENVHRESESIKGQIGVDEPSSFVENTAKSCVPHIIISITSFSILTIFFTTS